jgi:hypothetical protein
MASESDSAVPAAKMLLFSLLKKESACEYSTVQMSLAFNLLGQYASSGGAIISYYVWLTTTCNENNKEYQK